MRLGLYGGSFDPVHYGHLEVARCSQQSARLQAVWFIPTATQPLKGCGPVASDGERVAMLELAIAEEASWKVSEIELGRGGVSYTVDTLRQIRKQQPDAELFFLMGADSLHDFGKWREPAEILRLAMPLVVARAGEPEPDFGVLSDICPAEKLVKIQGHQVPMPAIPISSSEIRKLASRGESVERMTPADEFIRGRGVYSK